MSRSRPARFVVVCAPLDGDAHNVGIWSNMTSALVGLHADREDTGIPLECYSIEIWRGRQFNGRRDHQGRLIETRKGELVDESNEEAR